MSNPWVMRRSLRWGVVCLGAWCVAAIPVAVHGGSVRPVAFWASEPVGPGQVVLVYGGPFGPGMRVRVWRLADDPAGTPPTRAPSPAPPDTVADGPLLQPKRESCKFILPASLRGGVFGFSIGHGATWSVPRRLNAPRPVWTQLTRLRPHLHAGELVAGDAVQTMGRPLAPDGQAKSLRVALRAPDGARVTPLQVESAGQYDAVVRLPAELPAGRYALWVHNGRGGPGAWGGPLAVRVVPAKPWPTKRFDVREFGAKGDNIQHDTAAIEKALGAARANGGGVVVFPRGTFRLSKWLFIPPRTTLRGAGRDLTWLKWSLANPNTVKDITYAAVYTAGQAAFEDLSIVARNVQNVVYDASYDLMHRALYRFPVKCQSLGIDVKVTDPSRDLFLRRVRIRHLYLCGRPSRDLDKDPRWQYNRYGLKGQPMMLAMAAGGANLEITDCEFLGTQRFMDIDNGRITGNRFSNQLGNSWTDLAGRRIVFQDNRITGASSFRAGRVPLEYLHLARNRSTNIEMGEREAMTFDVHGFATPRNVSYWGSPIAVGNRPGNVYLKFPPAGQVSLDGCETAFAPDMFKGGEVSIRAHGGGPGGGQRRRVIRNTADTVYLDKPWNTPPDTQRRVGYLVVSRKAPKAWQGRVTAADAQHVRAKDAKWEADCYRGLDVFVMDGLGAGQYRKIVTHTADTITVDRPWDVVPDTTSVALVCHLVKHAVITGNQGYDTSVLTQFWGYPYDFVAHGNRLCRGQGMWGLGGWFVQWLDNTLEHGQSYHTGIGPAGVSPERTTPFGLLGFVTAGRIDQLPIKVPAVRAAVLRGNRLVDNQSIVVHSGYSTAKDKPTGRACQTDVVIDSNTICHTARGIILDSNTTDTVLHANRFEHVSRPYEIRNRRSCAIVK